MFFGRKYEKPPSPSWLKWVVIGFVLLAVIGNLHKNSPVHQAVSHASHDLNSEKITNFSEYKNLLFPHHGTPLDIKDITEGSGMPAMCGQQVTVSYHTIAQGGTSPDQTLTFRLGDGKAMPALEQGVSGMKTGGTRSIAAPPEMTDTHQPEQLEVTLAKAAPALPDPAASPYRIATLTPGSAPTAACGTPATVGLMLWDISGKTLYATKTPLTFTPGKSQVFLGLELGIVGLGQGGSRLLVVPPPFQRTMNGNKPEVDFPFPDNQTVLAEVKLLPPPATVPSSNDHKDSQ